MASDGTPGQLPATGSVQAGPVALGNVQAGGKTLPETGRSASEKVVASRATTAASAAPAPRAPRTKEPAALVTALNKFLNDSGRPDEFRLDPDSKTQIQQINPADGAVIGEFSIEEFPALARGLGVSGLPVDDVA